MSAGARASTGTPQARLRDQIAFARQQTARLFDLIDPAALYERPIGERHRIVFYIGHLEAFDWNLLREPLGLKTFDPALDRLFAFGIDPVDGVLPSDTAADWPAMVNVRAYATRISRELDSALYQAERVDPQLLHVAIEHRLMHAETLAYMLHQLPYEKKSKIPQAKVLNLAPPTPEMVEIERGSATLGLSRSSGSFGWDNEFDQHAVEVPAFSIDRYKVTNRQYLEYISTTGAPAPMFWIRDHDRWLFKGMFEAIPLPLSWPVYVSHAEAVAYAEWSGKRLPSEAQWHRAAYGTHSGDERQYPWGTEAPSREHGYFHFDRWDPAPVNAFPPASSGFGVEGLLANGWEWTSTVFAPLPGFQAFPFYPGYSANFFDGMHYVMKGGSPRTGESMLRRSFRNWFQAHYPYVYASFRCVKD